MIIVGLTGSIGMGKSTTARLFEDEGARVFDADAAVLQLYDPGGEAVEHIAKAFPGCASRQHGVDREKLSKALQANPDRFDVLNAIVHPLVGAMRQSFFKKAEEDDIQIIILDVPLLLETGQKESVDYVVVVSAPEDVQRERVLARKGMNSAKLDAILAQQMPDSKKRALADFVIDTSNGVDAARTQVRDIVQKLKSLKE